MRMVTHVRNGSCCPIPPLRPGVMLHIIMLFDQGETVDIEGWYQEQSRPLQPGYVFNWRFVQ